MSSRPWRWAHQYLPPEAQDRLLDNITALSTAGSRVATEYVPDMTVFTDERSNALTERLRRYGFNLDMSDLVYQGERSHVIEYLKARGWQPRTQTTPELHAANGFAFPDDKTMSAFADVSFMSAALTRSEPDSRRSESSEG